MARRAKTALVIVDGQIDFMGHADGTPFSLPYYGGSYTAALPVPGAVEDMERLCDYIEAEGPYIHDIIATFDAHNKIQIFHGAYWRDAQGNPAVVDISQGKFPFVITSQDIRSGKWVPHNATTYYKGINPKDPNKPMSGYDWALYYTEQLEQQGKDPLTIWPDHCRFGSVGFGLYPRLVTVLGRWEEMTGRNFIAKVKGNNSFTEHYGGLQAEVVIAGYADTVMDMGLVKMLREYDRVLFAGEASSHCVLTTVQQVVDGFGSSPLGNLCLLTDAMSPVALPGYPERAQAFIQKMKSMGMQTETTQSLKLAA